MGDAASPPGRKPEGPSPRSGRHGDPARWKAAVREQTAGSAKVEGPCQLDIEFVLPANSFPDDHPYGPDLDSLLKSTLDELKDSILKEVKGYDGGIIDLRARKRKAK